MPETTSIYDPSGTILAVIIDAEIWWPEDLQLLSPELLPSSGHAEAAPPLERQNEASVG